MATPTLLSVKMIWGKSPYSAFTDLIHFHDHFFCCFRESNSHQDGENGKIRILMSKDAVNWKSVALLASHGYDLRDPKFSITPQGQLMLNMGATIWGNNQSETINSAVSFSMDGKKWENILVLPYTGQWIWHVTWNQEGTAYGMAYSANSDGTTQVKLVSSSDGVNYNDVKFFTIPNSPTEATLRFLPDQTMLALLRRNDGPGLFGVSVPPYQDWHWSNTQSILGGPDFLIIDDKAIWASSRQTSGEDETCILAQIINGCYLPMLTFPSSGDCSYPGMVYRDGKLYVSYYASQTGKACIYLAVVQL
jgi:hypothetical protein